MELSAIDLNGEELSRRDYPQNTLSYQDGFEIPNLRKLVRDFFNRTTGNKPMGWLLTFFGTDTEGGVSTEWRAEYIKDIRVYDVSMKMEATDAAGTLSSLAFDDDWLGSLADENVTAFLDTVHLSDVKPYTVRLHHYTYASNYAKAIDVATAPPKLDIQEVGSTPGYGVGVIRGYRANMRAVYLDYNTMLQIYHAYALVAEPDPDAEDKLDNLRFLFTGAEINYGEMSSPIFQTERFSDWNKNPDGLDPSICSTLKIEPVYKLNEYPIRYTSGALYPGLETENGLTLPGLFILPSCRRYWEAITQIQKDVAPPPSLLLSKNGMKKGGNTVDKIRTGHKKILRRLTGEALEELISRKQVSQNS